MERSLLIERAISPNEVAIVQWLLDHTAVGDVTAYRAHPVEELRVVGGCDCGCVSMDFQPGGFGHSKIVADATAVYPDGQKAGLILWGRDGELTALEVHDYHPGSSHRMPEISNLRTAGGS
jgi:hypothetical protein